MCCFFSTGAFRFADEAHRGHRRRSSSRMSRRTPGRPGRAWSPTWSAPSGQALRLHATLSARAGRPRSASGFSSAQSGTAAGVLRCPCPARGSGLCGCRRTGGGTSQASRMSPRRRRCAPARQIRAAGHLHREEAHASHTAVLLRGISCRHSCLGVDCGRIVLSHGGGGTWSIGRVRKLWGDSVAWTIGRD